MILFVKIALFMHKFRRISFNICHVSFSSFFSSIFYQKLLKTCQILANYSCLAPSKFTDFLKIGKGNVPIKFFEHRILMSLFLFFPRELKSLVQNKIILCFFSYCSTLAGKSWCYSTGVASVRLEPGFNFVNRNQGPIFV